MEEKSRCKINREKFKIIDTDGNNLFKLLIRKLTFGYIEIANDVDTEFS